jgi:hypothetical protein
MLRAAGGSRGGAEDAEGCLGIATSRGSGARPRGDVMEGMRRDGSARALDCAEGLIERGPVLGCTMYDG